MKKETIGEAETKPNQQGRWPGASGCPQRARNSDKNGELREGREKGIYIGGDFFEIQMKCRVNFMCISSAWNLGQIWYALDEMHMKLINWFE